jgi:hypothetical protein
VSNAEAGAGAAAPSAGRKLGARGVGCLIIAGVATVATVGAVLERPATPPSAAVNAAPTAAQDRAARADDAEADDAVRALRAYYDLGQAVAAADWKWATCHDKTKGFEPLLACEKGVLDEIQSLRARMPTASAKSTCGHEIEDAHRLYVDGQERLHGDIVAWLEKRRAALTAAMRGRALTDACPAAGKACEDLPPGMSERYGAIHGASYARVHGIECTMRLFQCGPADNVCSVSKVASRLGLGPDAKRSGDLAVRTTGRRVQ